LNAGRSFAKLKAALKPGTNTGMGVMRLSAAVAASLLALSGQAGAQTNVPAGPQGRETTIITGVVTPERMTTTLENQAKQRQETGGAPFARTSQFFIFYGDNANEFIALGRYSVLLLTVVTQKPDELPLKRVYARAKDQEFPALPLSSWPVFVDEKSLSHKMYGPYREDGFYLVPTALVLREGQLLTDFAVNRTGLPIVQMPFKNLPERVSKFPNIASAAVTKPDLKFVQAFIARKTSGFPIPQSLP
jgi:hypothetical protein